MATPLTKDGKKNRRAPRPVPATPLVTPRRKSGNGTLQPSPPGSVGTPPVSIPQRPLQTPGPVAPTPPPPAPSPPGSLALGGLVKPALYVGGGLLALGALSSMFSSSGPSLPKKVGDTVGDVLDAAGAVVSSAGDLVVSVVDGAKLLITWPAIVGDRLAYPARDIAELQAKRFKIILEMLKRNALGSGMLYLGYDPRLRLRNPKIAAGDFALDLAHANKFFGITSKGEVVREDSYLSDSGWATATMVSIHDTLPIVAFEGEMYGYAPEFRLIPQALLEGQNLLRGFNCVQSVPIGSLRDNADWAREGLQEAAFFAAALYPVLGSVLPLGFTNGYVQKITYTDDRSCTEPDTRAPDGPPPGYETSFRSLLENAGWRSKILLSPAAPQIARFTGPVPHIGVDAPHGQFGYFRRADGSIYKSSNWDPNDTLYVDIYPTKADCDALAAANKPSPKLELALGFDSRLNALPEQLGGVTPGALTSGRFPTSSSRRARFPSANTQPRWWRDIVSVLEVEMAASLGNARTPSAQIYAAQRRK